MTRTALQRKQSTIATMTLQLVCEPQTKYKRRVAIVGPRDAAKELEFLRKEPEEHFVALHFNARNEIVGLHKVSHGTTSASLVHPREVYKTALLSNSHAVMVAHNHPGGSGEPSPEDLDTTKQLIFAGACLGVSLLDHLIFSSDKKVPVYSIREHHTHRWEMWVEEAKQKVSTWH